MQTREERQKFDELEQLDLETYALIDVLARALKYDEFENCPNANTVYLVEIIKEKFEKISVIIEDIQRI